MVVIYEETRLEQEPLPLMVSLIALSKVYERGDARIRGLDQVNLDVAAGEFCAFVGPSGCGKSTLLNLVAGLDRPTAGDIRLDGQSTTAFSADDWTRARRHLIGIVFQAFHLIPGLTVEENVAFPLLLNGQSGRKVRDRVDDVLALVGMIHRRHHRPGELSGGEQQRTAVARAIVHHPQIILADEPTGNLDSQQGADIIGLLRRFVQDFGQTVLLVTHSAAAARVADYAWTMKDGRLIERVDHHVVPTGG